MKRSHVILVLVGVLLGGIAIGFGLSHLGTLGIATGGHPANTADTRSNGKILYWHDPMVPNQRFDKPGKSPFMDMQLVPVYANDNGDSATVHVSSSVVQSLGIRLGKVEKTVLQRRLSAVGSVAFDERLLEVVQARIEGYVTRLYVKSPFERVKKGQRLAEILSPQWQSAQEEYVALLAAQSERGRSIRDAARQRLAVLGVPEAAITALERDRKVRASTTVFSPIEGVVTELAVREGAAFMSGAPLFQINGLGSVWVNAQVPEAQLAMVAMGSSVISRARGWPGETFAGHVIALLPEVDAQTRTLRARIAIDNRADKLAPGMFVSLELQAPESMPQLTVPSEAVILTGERNVVVVARDGGGFDVADVKVGAEDDGKTVILSGVHEGQSIVVSGQFLIDSEASLRSTISRLDTGAARDGTLTTEPPP